MNRVSAILWTFGVLLVHDASHPVDADETKTSEAAALIKDMANNICLSVPVEQHGTEWGLSADADAQLSGLLGKIAGLGLGAAGGYKKSSSSGVLQKDLADAIRDSNNCKLAVFNALAPKLLPGPPPPISPTPSPPQFLGPEASRQALVTTRNTMLRRTPNPYGATVEELSAGQKVVLLPQSLRDDGWRLVETQNTQADGYINIADLMRVSP